ncbi:MAG TPA: hypothetical protein VFW82_00950, partial [Dyella sp.]|nr:hypothetical protein [Dyella sp.]
MIRRHPLRVLLAGLIALGAGSAAAQDNKAWHDAQVAAAEHSERIMATAARHKDLLAQYRVMMDAAASAPADDRAFNVIFSQYLSWYQSFVGDYPNAQASYSIGQPAQPDDAPSPLAAGWQMQAAREAIARLAKGRRVVLFNEAHNVPLTRTLTVAMLATLRAEGFNYFAVETLYGDDHALARRGYVTADSGFYTREPIYAEMVRSALKLGFTVVAYESDQPGTADERERTQARNLYDRVFRHDPKARLVVNAGYAHIQESGAYLGGRSMAQYLQQLDDIDALTVEQTMLIPHPQAEQDHPWYTAAMAARHPDEPFVFVDHDGKPWSLRPGYDVSVFFPPPRLRRERPTWLSLWGLRRPYFISGDAACAQRWPCLVEALPANEGDDAVAADRLLFDPPASQPPLHDRLRPMRGAT